MKFLFDNRWPVNSGIGRYANEILSRSAWLCPVRPSNTPPFSPLDPFRLSIYLGQYSKDTVFISPGLNGPIVRNRRYCITMHDVNHIDLASQQPMSKVIYFQSIQKKLAESAELIFTVSQFSKRQISEWIDVPDEKIVVTGNGVADIFRQDVVPAHFDRPYFFYYGNGKPHKNLERLLRCFKDTRLNRDFYLVIAGPGHARTQYLASQTGVSDAVRFLGPVEDMQLVSLLKGAIALVFVSTYEGFGLPIVEAFSAGCPVITSSVTATQEVAGKAALLVDPFSDAEISEGMFRMTEDYVRDQFIALGRRRANEFTWDGVATVFRHAIVQQFGV